MTEGPWLEGLLEARTLAYKLATPLDRWLRRLAGRPELPPLWLRRHVGPVRHFESAAKASARWIDELALLEPGMSVLDMGCGCGAMVPELSERIGDQGRYLGFDVHGPSIEWCRRNHAADPRLDFVLAELVDSPYSRGREEGSEEARVAEYRFPVDDGSVDFVLAKSVFTHLLSEDTRHYLGEIGRALADQGRALVSTFVYDDRPGHEVEPAAFPHPLADPLEDQSGGRCRSKWRPTAAVAYPKGLFETWIEQAGLEARAFIPGFWPGEGAEPAGQDLWVLVAPIR